MLHYLKVLDPVNAKILEGMGRYGPRNTSFLARSVKLPATTVAFRIKKLIRKGYLHVRTNLDHSKLGLLRAALIAETAGGLDKQLREAIENIGYWTYTTRCHGRFDGIYALFAFPAVHRNKLEAYLKDVVRQEAMSNFVFHWITNLSEVPRSFGWFDFKTKAWKFPWRQWIDEVPKASEKLSGKLAEPKEYRVLVDETDMFLLKELEKNAFVEFTEIAKALEMSPQGVRYRYYKHIKKHGLVADYEIAILPYPLLVSDMCGVIVNFQNDRALARFSNTLSNKPFILSYGKIMGRSSLLLHSYAPRTEISNFVNALNSMVKEDLVADFLYVNFDVSSFKRQTVSSEFYKNESWVFDLAEKRKTLSEIMSK